MSKNHKEYSLFNRKWEIISTEVITSQTKSGHTYQHNKNTYGWVETETKLLDSNGPTILNSQNKSETFRGWVISCRDTSQLDYNSGVDIEYKVSLNTLYYNDSVDHLTKFIRKIPKRSRNKLIKLIYLYELNDVKTFYTFERLFYRLRTRFNLKFSSWSHTNLYQFELLKPTFLISSDRNRKINKLFRSLRG